MKLRNQDFYEEYVFTCNRCKSCTITGDHRCLNVCPSYDLYGFFTNCGGGKAHIAQKVLEGSALLDPDLCDAVYRCLLCQACKTGCPVTIDTYLVIRDLRELMVKKGLGPMEEQRPLLASLATYGYPCTHGGTRAARATWLKGYEIAFKDEEHRESEYLLYVGCSVVDNPYAAATAAASLRLLTKAGLDPVVLGQKEHCCGAVAAELGDRQLYLRVAKENSSAIRATGARTIVTICPLCYAYLKKEYLEDDALEWSPEIEVLHITDMLLRMISEGRLVPRQGISRKVTYHDPCHLGRHAEVYQSPRALLGAIPGIEFVEMERNKEHAYCCGGGTGVYQAYRTLSEAACKERLDEACMSGSDVLVTACPHCQRQFAQGIEMNHGKSCLEVCDIVTLLEASVE